MKGFVITLILLLAAVVLISLTTEGAPSLSVRAAAIADQPEIQSTGDATFEALSPADAGVYVEDFSSYDAKDYIDNTEWDIWAGELRLGRVGSVVQGWPPFVATDANGNSSVVLYSHGGLSAQRVDAQGNRLWQTTVNLGRPDVDMERNPAVAVYGDGNAIVVWGSGEGDGREIYVQRLDANGGLAWDPSKVVNSDGGANNNYSPDVAADDSGNMVVVWFDDRNGDLDIYAQQLNAAGQKQWGSDVRVNSDSGSASQGSVAVAMDGTGNAIVVWHDDRGGDYDIYAQKLDSSGDKQWASDVRVSLDSDASKQVYPDVAVDGSGEAIAVWEDYRDGHYAFYAQRLSASGSKAWAAEIRLTEEWDGAYEPEPGATAQHVVAVAADAAGNATVAWHDPFHPSDIHAQRLNAQGQKQWAADVLVNSDGQQTSHTHPALSLDPDGNAVVVWSDYRNIEGEVYAQELDSSGGKLWGGDVRVFNDTGKADQNGPDVAADGSGAAFVVWNDARNNHYDIYAQKVGGSGNLLWAEEVRAHRESGTASESSAAMAVDENGHAFVVWQDFVSQSGGNGVIYAQKLDGNGNKLWAADVRVALGEQDAPREEPAVAIDESGNAIVVWAEGTYGSSKSIRAQKLDQNGNQLWATDVAVNSDIGPILWSRPVVATYGGGNAIVIWQDGDDQNIYAQSIDGDGSSQWGTDVRVNAVGETVDENKAENTIAVATDGGQNAIIAWSNNFTDTVAVYVQKIDSSGNRLWTESAIVAETAKPTYAASNDVDVDMGSNGQAILAWDENLVFPNYHLAVQMIDADGAPLWPEPVQLHHGEGGGPDSSPSVALDGSGNAYIAWAGGGGTNDIFVQKLATASGAQLWSSHTKPVDAEEFYLGSGMAQSLAVDDSAGEILQAVLQADYEVNSGTVDFFLSNNGGQEWYPAAPNVAVVFPTTGSDLRWRAQLTGAPLWPRAPVVSSLSIAYDSGATLFLTNDSYEPNDTCQQAKPIAVNGAVQSHSFHQQADADWAQFDVVTGTTYIIQIANTESNVDAELELYDTCAHSVASGSDAFGTEIRLTFQAPYSGTLYAKATNHDPLVYGTDTGYEFSVRTYSDYQAPLAVIVAGHDDSYSLQSNIDYAADQAYNTLLSSGVPKDNVLYLGPSTQRDVDRNLLSDDIAGEATPANVRDAIQDWAREQGVGIGVPFYLYLMDHGHVDVFLADGSDGRISASDLDLWLGNLEATSGADNINVIIEACRSGSFIDVTSIGPDSISKQNRVVIASTSSDLNAFPSTQGAVFSDVFWTAVGQNKDLDTAFQSAQQAVQATGLSQAPWLDDTGDAQMDTSDGYLASGRGLGAAFAGSPPIIDWVTLGDIVSGTATIQAQVRDDFGVSRVWVTIYPPDYVEPPPSDDVTTPEVNAPEADLVAAGSDLFEMNYDGFTQAGQYRLVVYARDADGDQALPQVMIANSGYSIYLPLVTRLQ